MMKKMTLGLSILSLLSVSSLFPCAFFIQNDTAHRVLVHDFNSRENQVIEAGNTTQIGTNPDIHAKCEITVGTRKSNEKYRVYQTACSKAHKIQLSVNQVRNWNMVRDKQLKTILRIKNIHMPSKRKNK